MEWIDAGEYETKTVANKDKGVEISQNEDLQRLQKDTTTETKIQLLLESKKLIILGCVHESVFRLPYLAVEWNWNIHISHTD